LPPPVIDRARAILRTLESESGPGSADLPRPVAPADAETTAQLGLFGGHMANDPMLPVLTEVAATLRATDPDELSPRAAHDLLTALVKKLTHPL
jgi:DNA mismatch repair ATPase MutS